MRYALAGVNPRRAHVGTLQREAVKVSEWVIYLIKVYENILGNRNSYPSMKEI